MHHMPRLRLVGLRISVRGARDDVMSAREPRTDKEVKEFQPAKVRRKAPAAEAAPKEEKKEEALSGLAALFG
jgi:hypothetical protein